MARTDGHFNQANLLFTPDFYASWSVSLIYGNDQRAPLVLLTQHRHRSHALSVINIDPDVSLREHRDTGAGESIETRESRQRLIEIYVDNASQPPRACLISMYRANQFENGHPFGHSQFSFQFSIPLLSVEQLDL